MTDTLDRPPPRIVEIADPSYQPSRADMEGIFDAPPMASFRAP